MPTVLMTGGHSGLGLTGARTLIQRYGCDLILAGRSRPRVEACAKELKQDTGRDITVVEMDLDFLESVRKAATECNAILAAKASPNKKLQGIICNAGVQSFGPVEYSAEGYEKTFADNCLGHFLLVNLLINSIADDGRIVWTSSGTHDPALLDGKTVGIAATANANELATQGLNGRHAISGGRRYATSKLCIIMYAYELDRQLRHAGQKISSIAYDPGFLPDAGMGLSAPKVFRNSLVKKILAKFGMTIGQMPLSGEALAILSQDNAYSDVSGKYFHAKDGNLSETRSSAASYEKDVAAKLWIDSNLLVSLPITGGSNHS